VALEDHDRWKKIRICSADGGHGEVHRRNRGIQRNLNTFHQRIVNGIYDNPTVEPSVNATPACILGREAARRNKLLTWDEMIREHKTIEVSLIGLKD
jgi:hypothetical protein